MKRLVFLLSAFSCPLIAGNAEDLISQSGVKGGIVVHVGCGDASVTRKLRVNDSYQVHGLTKEAAKLPELRDSLYKDGVSGVVAAKPISFMHH